VGGGVKMMVVIVLRLSFFSAFLQSTIRDRVLQQGVLGMGFCYIPPLYFRKSR